MPKFYNIQTFELKRAGSHAVEQRTGANIGSMAALREFIDDYVECRTDYPYLVLNSEMAMNYYAWRIKYDERFRKQKLAGLGTLANMAGSAAKADVPGLFQNLAGLYAHIAREMLWERDHTEMLTLVRHANEEFEGGKIGVCLHCNTEGQPYAPNSRLGWVRVVNNFRSRRMV